MESIIDQNNEDQFNHRQAAFQKFVTVILILTTAFFASTTFYFATKNPKKVIAPTVNLPEASPAPAQSDVPNLWTKATMGSLSFEYPTGWHVASLWPNEPGGVITLVINPTLVDTAPRDGALGRFTITLHNEAQNAEAAVARLTSDHTPANFTDIQVETLQSDGGMLEFFSGKIAGEFLHGTRIQRYVLKPTQIAGNPSGYISLIGTCLFCDLDTDALIFRRLMMSFKQQP